MTIPPPFQIIRGGRLLDHRAHRAEPADVLIEGDTVREVGPPGMAAPEDAAAVDATGRLLHPGLINAHTHCHGALAKGMGDRWSLELLLAAAPWIGGSRTRDDQYLAAQLNAVEMVLKGCTAAYDLFCEYPAPSPEGLEAVASAFASTVVLWARHVPAAYDLALSHVGVYWTMQHSLPASATWFWREVFASDRSPVDALAFIVAGLAQMGMLGAILTFAPNHFVQPFRVRDYGQRLPITALVWAFSPMSLLVAYGGIAR